MRATYTLHQILFDLITVLNSIMNYFLIWNIARIYLDENIFCPVWMQIRTPPCACLSL